MVKKTYGRVNDVGRRRPELLERGSLASTPPYDALHQGGDIQEKWRTTFAEAGVQGGDKAYNFFCVIFSSHLHVELLLKACRTLDPDGQNLCV